MKRWCLPGKIIGGECSLVVLADSREEAAEKFKAGDWEVESGSESWECEPDVDDEDEIDSAVEEG